MRMVDFPVGLPIRTQRPLGGPGVLGQTQSETEKTQVVTSPFGDLIRWEVTCPPMKGRQARAFKTLAAAANSGANCFRMELCDFDEPGFDELGLDISTAPYVKVPLSNGEALSNGELLTLGKPLADIVAASAKNSGTVTIDASAWGGVLPTWFGIVGHFAAYFITGAVFNGDIATCRVWPPVRRAITTGDFATMRPVVAMQVIGEGGAPWSRQIEVQDGMQISMQEVLDEIVRTYVTEDYP